MTLPRNKIALIHVGRSRLGLGDADYRALLRRVAGVESSTKLNDFTFGLVLQEFVRLGFRSDFAARNIGQRPGMATPAQIARLRADWRRYTTGQGTDRSLGKWLGRFGASDVRFLTADAAHRAIGALSKMLARKTGHQRGAA